MSLRIIGLAGTNGSGKDTVGHILAEQYGFLFVSVTDLLRNETKRRGLPVDREHLRALSAEWRREAGLGVLMDKALAEFEPVRDKYAGLAIASLRNPGEADRLHELGGTVVWVDADPRLRYERVQAGAASRGRAGEDRKTYEQFLAEEQAEMHASGDAATLDMAAVKSRSDITLNNNSNDPADLRRRVGQSLNLS